MKTLNSIQTLSYIKFLRNNTMKLLPAKQERNYKYLENCRSEYINEKLMQIEYLKNVFLKFEKSTI